MLYCAGIDAPSFANIIGCALESHKHGDHGRFKTGDTDNSPDSVTLLPLAEQRLCLSFFRGVQSTMYLVLRCVDGSSLGGRLGCIGGVDLACAGPVLDDLLVHFEEDLVVRTHCETVCQLVKRSGKYMSTY